MSIKCSKDFSDAITDLRSYISLYKIQLAP